MPYKDKEKQREYMKEHMKERQRKDGKYYEKYLKYMRTGLRRERNLIRQRDRDKWKKYKQIFAQETEIHHEWIPGTAEYNGIAIVDKMEHQHDIINPIEILEGEIKLMGVI